MIEGYSYYNDVEKAYLSRESEASTNSSAEFEIRMIVGNKPEGLVFVHNRRENGKTYLDYDISGLKPLSECDRNMDAARLYSVIFSLERMNVVLKEFMLRAECLVLIPELIFFREESGMTQFLYDPDQMIPLQDGLGKLMEYFLKILVPTEEKEVLLLYGLYHQTRDESVTLRTLAEYWRNSGNNEITSAGKVTQISDNLSEIYEELGMSSNGLLADTNGNDLYLGDGTGKMTDRNSEDGNHADGNYMYGSRRENTDLYFGEHNTKEEARRVSILGELKNYLKTYRFECGVIIVVVIISTVLLLR